MKVNNLILYLLVSLTGCSALQEKASNYVEEAVVQKIETTIDAKLAAKGLSTAQIKSTIDTNGDGKLSQKEIMDALKEYSKDLVALELQKTVQSQGVVTKEQLEQKWKDASSSSLAYLVTTLGGLIFAYLTKQVFAAKADGHRDAKLDILQTLFLNGNTDKLDKNQDLQKNT